MKSVQITGLISGTTYEIRIRSVNRVGPGQWSDVISAKTEGIET